MPFIEDLRVFGKKKTLHRTVFMAWNFLKPMLW